MTDAPYTPDIAAIVADLKTGHVHVDSAVADAIGADQLAAVKATVQGSELPMYVIAAPLAIRSDLTPVQLVSLVHRQFPEDGVYFVSQPSYDGSWRLASTSYGVVTDNANALAGYTVAELYPADLGLQLQHATEMMVHGTARQEYDKVFPDVHSSTSTQDDSPPQILGMDLPVAGLVLGLIVALVVAAVPLLRRRARARHELVVKGRVLRRISTAQTQDWRHRAEAEVAALGDRINTLQIATDSDRAAWSAALDHYQAATGVLDGSTDAADSIGAMVLARRGDDALDHAVAGKPWTASPVCFFNPFHGAATTKARWKISAGSRDVPCCANCRKDIRRRREPDFLDLPVGDTVVHYVDADAEPWTSTGYGALDTELLARL